MTENVTERQDNPPEGGAGSSGRPILDIVRCCDFRPWEEDWYTSVLGDYELRFHSSPDFSLVLPNALYMAPGSLGLGHIPAAFLERVRDAGNCGLIHLGDEFMRGPYSVYANFAYVVKTHYASFIESPAVLTIPLGYSNNMQRRRGLASSQRKYAWGFTGAKGLARVQLGKIWKPFAPNFFHLVDLREGGQHLSRAQFLDLLDQSAFIPCPMGNAHLESLRIYEALERGAMPIVSTRRKLPYFDLLLGADHPLPQFENWTAARDWAQDIHSRPADLDALQEKILSWWEREQVRVRETAGAFVAAGMTGAFRERLVADFSHRSESRDMASRLVELYRHHDGVTMLGRVQITSRKLAKKVGLVRS